MPSALQNSSSSHSSFGFLAVKVPGAAVPYIRACARMWDLAVLREVYTNRLIVQSGGPLSPSRSYPVNDNRIPNVRV
jgi:hypothetical protein